MGGRSKGMIFGILLIIVSILGLGSLKYVQDAQSFVIMSFVWKFLCGLGAGMNSTASMSIVATHYKKEREKAIGLIEAASGVGLLLGPFFGAILYQIGGYTMPFTVTGKVNFLTLDSWNVLLHLPNDSFLSGSNPRSRTGIFT